MATPSLVPLLKPSDTFSSYKEFRRALEKYERVNRVQFWIRDAKRLHRAPPSIYELVKDHPELEYCSFKLSCIHGGKPYQQKKSADRTRKSKGTFRQDCKASIFVKLNEDKNRLMIAKFCEEHNHDIPTEGVFKHLPKLRRRCSEKNQRDRGNLFTSKLKRRNLKEKGICLENIIKSNSLSRSKNFEKIATLLKEKYCCVVDLQKDEKDKIYGFFFQDEYMKECFKLFPEILLVDGSYKLQNIQCSIYILSVENSMGSCDIVGVGVLTIEDKDSVDWLFGKFKGRNLQYEDTTIVLTDRQSAEYKVSKHFPNAKCLICSLHSLQMFKKDVQERKKFKILPSDAERGLAFFGRLMNVQSEDEYTSILEEMEDNLSLSFNNYFYNKWHDLRYSWVRKFSPTRTFFQSRLEEMSSTFREKIASCKTFNSFIEKLFFHVASQRKKLKHQFFDKAMKFFTTQTSTPVEKKYDKCLTLYAFNKVKVHLILANASKFIFTEKGDDVICQTKDDSFLVSKLNCGCDFFVVLGLPCEHVLLYRKAQQMDLFDECLFSERWTRKYMGYLLEKEFAGMTSEDEGSYETKFAEAERMCMKLAVLCSESSEFRKRMDFLANLQRRWEMGDDDEEEEEGECESRWEMGDEEEEQGEDMEEGGECESERIILEITS